MLYVLCQVSDSSSAAAHWIMHSFFGVTGKWVETGHCGLWTERKRLGPLSERDISTQLYRPLGRLIKKEQWLGFNGASHETKNTYITRLSPPIHPPDASHPSLYTPMGYRKERRESKSLKMWTKDWTEILGIDLRESKDPPQTYHTVDIVYWASALYLKENTWKKHFRIDHE